MWWDTRDSYESVFSESKTELNQHNPISETNELCTVFFFLMDWPVYITELAEKEYVSAMNIIKLKWIKSKLESNWEPESIQKF